MTSPTIPVFGTREHPAGQIIVSTPRNIAARSSALLGQRADLFSGRTLITRVHPAEFDAVSVGVS